MAHKAFYERMHENAPALLMSAGGCCFTLMDTFAKLLVDKKGIPSAFVVFSRMLITATLLPAYLAWKGVEDPVLGPKALRHLLVIRAIGTVFCLVLLYGSFKYIGVGDATALFFTCPIITAVVAAIVLKEPYTLMEAACGSVSFVGVVFITKPSMIFDNSQQTDLSLRTLSYFMLGGATLLAAGSFVITRYIGARIDVLFFTSYLGGVGSIVMAFVMIALPGQRPSMATLDSEVAIYVIGLTFTGFLATYLENVACQMAKVGRVTLYLYVQLPFAVFVSWAVFADPMTGTSILGSCIIIGAAVLVTLVKERGAEVKDAGEESEQVYEALPSRAAESVIVDIGDEDKTTR